MKYWDCDAMYPKPVRFDPDVIGEVTEYVKMGFEIYNKIKELLPDGSAAGPGEVQGTPGGSSSSSGSSTSTNPFDNIGGGGVTELGKILGGDDDETWDNRLRIWARAV